MSSFLQIQTFLEVARSGSFADASRRLSVPRSTVSARVRALEERLNVRLLHRTTRRVALTDEGRRYRERCQEAVDKLVEAEAELSRPDDVSGTIRVTVPVDMSKRPLARALTSFTDRYPSIRIEAIVTDEIVDLVASNIDLALRGGNPGAAGLVARRLGEGKLALYASPDYAAKKLRGKTLSTLSGHVIFDPANQGKAFVAANAQRGRVETRSFGLAKALAVQSRGIALLPESICREEVEAGQLARLAFAKPLSALPVYIVMPTRLHVPARVRAFVDFLIAAEKQSSIV
ncbi:MAG: LysR family transcriptional regulator [Rhodospirillales bacterium]|nr:LysR family transcriptional regulator [Rhodospirillales bacterium]